MKKYIKPITIVSEIKMIRAKKNKQSYLLVEGDSDEKFFKNIVNKDCCKVRGMDGKKNVLDIIKILNSQRIQGVVGIVDSDFDNITLNRKYEENIFSTDTHDMETLILKTGSIEKVLNEYANDEKINRYEELWGNSLLNKCIEAAMKIGCLRLASIQKNMNLNFTDLDYNEFIDKSIMVDIDKLLVQVMYSSGRNTSEKYKILEVTNRVNDENLDKWQVSCGHDITSILALVLSEDFDGENLGNHSAKHITSTKLETELRLSYDYEKFIDTKLYEKMYTWQENNPTWIIISYEKLESAS